MSPKKAQMISALLSTSTIEKAAARVGITARTAQRWMNDESFRQQLAAAEAELIGEAARSMAAGAREAAYYLRFVLQQPDDKVSPSEKIRAAGLLLSAMPPLRVLGALEGQIERLELAVTTRNQAPAGGAGAGSAPPGDPGGENEI